MTEGTVTRTKRMGTRFFKNPPQPHMCIQDFLRGSGHPCYINVLSWDKIAMGSCPFERLSLYGGMKINPPRTEKPDVNVFFVMANPEVLRQKGKNASDHKEQSILIELLLNFIEAMNTGVEFMRQYKILNDRDITGELKEIWMVVQSDRARVQNDAANEDVKRPVPQYPQYSEQDQKQEQQQLQQQKQQQKKQHQQQYRPPPPQTQQHQHQVQQIHQNHSEETHQQIQSQPPQYHSSYSMSSRGPAKASDNYDLAYVRQTQNQPIAQNDHIYQPWSTSLQYANRVRRMEHQIGSREAREFLASSVPSNTPVPPQHPISYPAPQYQYQLSRPIGPPYNGPKVHPNAGGLGCSTITNPGGIPPVINTTIAPGSQMHYDHYYLSMRLPEKSVCVKVHRVQQPQQPQIQIANPIHAAPVPPYESIDPFYDPQINASFNWRKSLASQNNTMQPKNNINKRQNSPTNAGSNGPKENSVKNKSPVKVLQRDNCNSNTDPVNSVIFTDKSDEEFENAANKIKKQVQVTDLDEDEPRITETCDDSEIFKNFNDMENHKITQENNYKKQNKTKIMVLKRNKSFNDSQSLLRNGKTVKNGVGIENEQPSNIENKVIEKKNEQPFVSESERNGFNNDKQLESDDRISKTVNNCNNSASIINPSTSEDNGKQHETKVNGQVNNFNKNKEQVYQVYTILRKSDVTSTQDELTNETAQIAIKDCTDTSEIGIVPS
ncbi:putative uncharacterized protein DDB_G0271606 [Microplitis demolitor]|uniref:putative uncharacterized protein DDB_G0271606 n=1 Tax=Microplitis demolitor TaxID=69319 RepID=UPI0004CD264A|nr:putative uncharacterized protein DDB_G0271606 [Microplitis demolitor]XP_008553593.1 putative uncharacterized protein DDB_G0271606 [Microplitis demolitor]